MATIWQHLLQQSSSYRPRSCWTQRSGALDSRGGGRWGPHMSYPSMLWVKGLFFGREMRLLQASLCAVMETFSFYFREREPLGMVWPCWQHYLGNIPATLSCDPLLPSLPVKKHTGNARRLKRLQRNAKKIQSPINLCSKWESNCLKRIKIIFNASVFVLENKSNFGLNTQC